jgi:hypothetical protein
MKTFQYIVFRLRRADAPREYWVSRGTWSDDVRDAKRMGGEQASVLCENLGVRDSVHTFLMTVDRYARRES